MQSSLLDRAASAGLRAALAASGGALQEDGIAICASLYARPLLGEDPGPFAAQTLWRHRAGVQIYPASLCKLVYLAALAAFEAEGRIVLDSEDHRATRAMIALSSNEATAFLLGRLTGAFDGPVLDPEALEDWCRAREAVQHWLAGLGLPALDGCHLIHATYEDSPYGRAKQARGARPGNTMSAEAGALMLHEMLRGALPGRDWMAGHLGRDWQREAGPYAEGDQVTGFLGEGLPPEVRFWSKAGHTSATRHDIAYALAPDGRGCLLSVMTEGAWTSRHGLALPAFARAFTAEAFA